MEAFQSTSFAGSHLLDAECRTSICRLEYEHADGSARDRFRSNLERDSAFQETEIDAQATDDQKLHYVMFLSREGTRLPHPKKD